MTARPRVVRQDCDSQSESFRSDTHRNEYQDVGDDREKFPAHRPVLPHGPMTPGHRVFQTVPRVPALIKQS